MVTALPVIQRLRLSTGMNSSSSPSPVQRRAGDPAGDPRAAALTPGDGEKTIRPTCACRRLRSGPSLAHTNPKDRSQSGSLLVGAAVHRDLAAGVSGGDGAQASLMTRPPTIPRAACDRRTPIHDQAAAPGAGDGPGIVGRS